MAPSKQELLERVAHLVPDLAREKPHCAAAGGISPSPVAECTEPPLRPCPCSHQVQGAGRQDSSGGRMPGVHRRALLRVHGSTQGECSRHTGCAWLCPAVCRHAACLCPLWRRQVFRGIGWRPAVSAPPRRLGPTCLTCSAPRAPPPSSKATAPSSSCTPTCPMGEGARWAHVAQAGREC